MTRLAPDAFVEPSDFHALADALSAKIKFECPGVEWKHSWVGMGAWDVMDVVEAEDPKSVAKGRHAHPLIRSCLDRDYPRHALEGIPGQFMKPCGPGYRVGGDSSQSPQA